MAGWRPQIAATTRREDRMRRFDGKVVLISGGARGQGAAEARLLVAEGGKVVLGDLLEAEGQALAAELGPSSALFLRQDVTEEADWARAVAAAVETFGGLHGLVNNAGIYVPKTLMETDAALFERHMRVNQLGCFLGMKAVVPAMERAGGGAIVNISSVAGLRGSPGAIAYSATKWALRGMTKAAALDLAPRGIRVNSVHPGPIDTEMLKVRTPEQNRARVELVPMKRMGTAEEVAKLVLFLLSDDSAYITGAEVAIDGGAAL
jgi:3alpha(or 20beta)-hydroxysteroid dehydrogenase